MTPKFWASVGMHCSHRVAQKYQHNIFCDFSSHGGKGWINGGLLHDVTLVRSYQQFLECDFTLVRSYQHQCFVSRKNTGFTQLNTIMRNISKLSQHNPIILNVVIRSNTFHCSRRLYSACREKIRVHFQGSPCVICVWIMGNGTGYLVHVGFPLSVYFRHCCMFIHSSITDAV